MHSDPPASERAYQLIKSSLVSGKLRAGLLDLGGLADDMRMSITPVREALARLHAERLVRLSPHQGYTVTPPSSARLADLYALYGILTHHCLQGRIRREGQRPIAIAGAPATYADDLMALLTSIAQQQPNAALAEMMRSLDDQLFAARRVEPSVFPSACVELASLVLLWTSGDNGDLRLRLKSYHRSRLLKVDVIARLLGENPSVT